jgi:hypothetical protein
MAMPHNAPRKLTIRRPRSHKSAEAKASMTAGRMQLHAEYQSRRVLAATA